MSKLQIMVALFVVLVVVAYASLFRVYETESALLLRFGQVQSSDFPPGLHFKIPFIENVRKFDKRILTLDAKAELFLTIEKKNVSVDSFVKWHIINTESFYTSMGGKEGGAGDRISQIINRGLRDEFGKRTIQEAISGERQLIMKSLLAMAPKQLKEYGIGIVDVRIKRIDLPKNVSDSVFNRMRSERKRVAQEFRSQGAEEAEGIRAQADREKEIIESRAFRDAEKTRGAGDAKAAAIYAKAFKSNPEFYAFYRSLFAYREVFPKSGKNVLVIEPKSDFFRYFRNNEPVKSP